MCQLFQHSTSIFFHFFIQVFFFFFLAVDSSVFGHEDGTACSKGLLAVVVADMLAADVTLN